MAVAVEDLHMDGTTRYPLRRCRRAATGAGLVEEHLRDLPERASVQAVAGLLVRLVGRDRLAVDVHVRDGTGVGEAGRTAVARALDTGGDHIGAQLEAVVGARYVNRVHLADAARHLLRRRAEDGLDPRRGVDGRGADAALVVGD